MGIGFPLSQAISTCERFFIDKTLPSVFGFSIIIQVVYNIENLTTDVLIFDFLPQMYTIYIIERVSIVDESAENAIASRDIQLYQHL